MWHNGTYIAETGELYSQKGKLKDTYISKVSIILALINSKKRTGIRNAQRLIRDMENGYQIIE